MGPSDESECDRPRVVTDALLDMSKKKINRRLRIRCFIIQLESTRVSLEVGSYDCILKDYRGGVFVLIPSRNSIDFIVEPFEDWRVCIRVNLRSKHIR